jgi:hypothetical protein
VLSWRGNGNSSGCALRTIGVRVAVGDGVDVTVGVYVCVGVLVAEGEGVIVGVRALGGSGGGSVELAAAAASSLSTGSGILAAWGTTWHALNAIPVSAAQSFWHNGNFNAADVIMGRELLWGWASMWLEAAGS